MTFDEFIRQTVGAVGQRGAYEGTPPIPGGVHGVNNPYATEYTGPPPVSPNLGNLPPIPGAGGVGSPYATEYAGPAVQYTPPLGNLPPIPGAGAVANPYATTYTGTVPNTPVAEYPGPSYVPPVPGGVGVVDTPYAQNPTGPVVTATPPPPGSTTLTPSAPVPPTTPGGETPGGGTPPGGTTPPAGGGAFGFGGGNRFDPYSGAGAAQYGAGGAFDPNSEAGRQQLNTNPLLAAQVAAFQKYGAFNQMGDEFKRFVLDNLNRAASNASLQAFANDANNVPPEQRNVFGQMQGDLNSGNFFSPATSRGLLGNVVNMANSGNQAAIDYLTSEDNRRAILNYALQGMSRINPYYDYVLRNQNELQNVAGGGGGAWLEFLRTRGLV